MVLSISRVLLNTGRFCLTGVLTHPGGSSGTWFATWPTPSFKRFRGMLPAQEPSSVAVSKQSSFWSAVHQFPCIPPLENSRRRNFGSLLFPLPLTSRVCQWPSTYRAACSRAGVPGNRGYALESAAARVCREAGGRVSTNVFLRDMALDSVQADGRRLEVVVDGLPLFRGAQLAIDTTLVSPLRGDGQPHRRCVDAALDEARRRNERTYPELCERHSRARLVLLVAEVGGRWSDEAADFLKQLAKVKARGVPRVLQVRTRQVQPPAPTRRSTNKKKHQQEEAATTTRSSNNNTQQRRRLLTDTDYIVCCAKSPSSD